MQIALLVEPFRAVWIRTDKWLFSSVDSHVGFQVEIQRESLVAQITFVWFFTLKIHHLVKMLLTVWTSICRFSFALSRNLLPQPSCVHWKSLSPCTVLCFFRDALSWKIFPQLSRGHRKIFGCWWLERPVGLRPTIPRGRFFSRVDATGLLGFFGLKSYRCNLSPRYFICSGLLILT